MKQSILAFVGIFILALAPSCVKEKTVYESTTINDTIRDTIVQVDTVVQNIYPDSGTVIFLARHTETDGGGNNPHLSTAGQQRADRLRETLKENQLSAVYSTIFHRTTETAEIVAAEFGLTVTEYDAVDLQAFSEKILSEHVGERLLVVGHLNTTPELINILVGSGLVTINDTIYDNLFIVDKDSISAELLPLKY